MSKIVVVDDSYAELQMIESYLKSANHTVVSLSQCGQTGRQVGGGPAGFDRAGCRDAGTKRLPGLSGSQERRSLQEHSHRVVYVERTGE